MGKLFAGILRAWEKLGAEMQLLTGCLLIAIVYTVSNYRTDTNKSSEFVLQQLKNCETRLDKCEMELLKTNEKWGAKYDTLTWKFINFKTQIDKITDK